MNMQNDRGAEKLKEKCSSGLFKHYVSLGDGCYVARNLESMGLRAASLPFDWIAARWRAVERTLKTSSFDGFLDYDCLFQKKDELRAYKNNDYGVAFFHDFSEYKPLSVQMQSVIEKYDRRIDRFFKYVKEPTLFIRRCFDESELDYIATNYDMIENMIKSYNPQNEIVFISHNKKSKVDTNGIEYIFFIEGSSDAGPIKNPIISSKTLYDILSNAEYTKRQENLLFYEKKQAKKLKNNKSFSNRLRVKIQKVFPKKSYIHDKQCDS